MKNEEGTRCTICGYDKKMLVIVITLIIIAGGAFYVGAKYEKNKLSKLGLMKNNKSEICLLPGVVEGEIISKNDNMWRIKIADGSTQEVFISASTKMSKKSTGTLTDLALGQQVSINGIKNVDGSFLAQTIKQVVEPSQVK